MQVIELGDNNELENSLIKMEEKLNNTQSTAKPVTVHSDAQNISRHSRPISRQDAQPAANLIGGVQPTFYAERLKTLRDKI